MRVPSKHSEKDLQTTRITDAENTYDCKYWYADHIKRKLEDRSPGTWIKTAPDRKNTVDRRKIYNTTTEAHFLPYVHLLVQAHHSTAKHTSHNSRVMATRLPELSRAKQFEGKWHWALAWKPQDWLDSERLILTIQHNLEIYLFYR